MSTRWIVVALGSALLLAAPAFAQKTYVPKVMVFDLTADPSFHPTTLRAINDFLAGAIHDQGFRVLTREDVSAAVGLDKQKKLLGCNDSNCLAEIGGAMGADYIVRGNLATLDHDVAITLSLVDTKGQSLSQVRRLADADSTSDLIRAVEDMVPKLMVPVKRPHEQPKPPPVAAGGLADSTSVEAASGPHGGAYALVGGGATALVAGGVLGVLSLLQFQSANQSAAQGQDFHGAVSTSLLEGRIGVPLMAVGTAAVIAGAVIWASSGPPKTASAP